MGKEWNDAAGIVKVKFGRGAQALRCVLEESGGECSGIFKNRSTKVNYAPVKGPFRDQDLECH